MKKFFIALIVLITAISSMACAVDFADDPDDIIPLNEVAVISSTLVGVNGKFDLEYFKHIKMKDFFEIIIKIQDPKSKIDTIESVKINGIGYRVNGANCSILKQDKLVIVKVNFSYDGVNLFELNELTYKNTNQESANVLISKSQKTLCDLSIYIDDDVAKEQIKLRTEVFAKLKELDAHTDFTTNLSSVVTGLGGNSTVVANLDERKFSLSVANMGTITQIGDVQYSMTSIGHFKSGAYFNDEFAKIMPSLSFFSGDKNSLLSDIIVTKTINANNNTYVFAVTKDSAKRDLFGDLIDNNMSQEVIYTITFYDNKADIVITLGDRIIIIAKHTFACEDIRVNDYEYTWSAPPVDAQYNNEQVKSLNMRLNDIYNGSYGGTVDVVGRYSKKYNFSIYIENNNHKNTESVAVCGNNYFKNNTVIKDSGVCQDNYLLETFKTEYLAESQRSVRDLNSESVKTLYIQNSTYTVFYDKQIVEPAILARFNEFHSVFYGAYEEFTLVNGDLHSVFYAIVGDDETNKKVITIELQLSRITQAPNIPDEYIDNFPVVPSGQNLYPDRIHFRSQSVEYIDGALTSIGNCVYIQCLPSIYEVDLSNNNAKIIEGLSGNSLFAFNNELAVCSYNNIIFYDTVTKTTRKFATKYPPYQFVVTDEGIYYSSVKATTIGFVDFVKKQETILALQNDGFYTFSAKGGYLLEHDGYVVVNYSIEDSMIGTKDEHYVYYKGECKFKTTGTLYGFGVGSIIVNDDAFSLSSGHVAKIDCPKKVFLAGEVSSLRILAETSKYVVTSFGLYDKSLKQFVTSISSFSYYYSDIVYLPDGNIIINSRLTTAQSNIGDIIVTGKQLTSAEILLPNIVLPVFNISQTQEFSYEMPLNSTPFFVDGLLFFAYNSGDGTPIRLQLFDTQTKTAVFDRLLPFEKNPGYVDKIKIMGESIYVVFNNGMWPNLSSTIKLSKSGVIDESFNDSDITLAGINGELIGIYGDKFAVYNKGNRFAQILDSSFTVIKAFSDIICIVGDDDNIYLFRECVNGGRRLVEVHNVKNGVRFSTNYSEHQNFERDDAIVVTKDYIIINNIVYDKKNMTVALIFDYRSNGGRVEVRYVHNGNIFTNDGIYDEIELTKTYNYQQGVYEAKIVRLNDKLYIFHGISGNNIGFSELVMPVA